MFVNAMDTIILRCATLLIVAVGCGNPEFPPAAPDDAKARDLFGTGRNDVWRYWRDSTVQVGPLDPKPHQLRHFDGKSSVDVAVPAIFTEAACGEPQSIVAAERGRLWLASTYRWACGQATDPTNSRIIVGAVSRDGTWVDRSASVPSLAPPATYDSVELAGAYGVVLLTVQMRDAAGNHSVHHYRLGDTDAVEIATTTSSGGFVFLDADHIYLAVGSARASLTHKLEGDQLVALPAPIAIPGGIISRGGPEVWVWSTNDVVQQAQNRVAYRFDGSAFQEVAFEIDDVGSPYTWQAIGLVARGNGKASLLGQRAVNTGFGSSNHALTARQLDGTKLTGDAEVFGPIDCAAGDNDAGEACSRIKAGYYKILEDGTMIVTATSYIEKPYTLSIITPDQVP